jgi:hypothetical protein
MKNSVFPLEAKSGFATTPPPVITKSQVIGVRISVPVWHEFEMRCIENNSTMSNVLRLAVDKFIQDTRENDKTTLP